MNIAPKLLLAALFALSLTMPEGAHARAGAPSPDLRGTVAGDVVIDSAIAQSGGLSLSEAIAQVRRRGNVDRIISAETRRSGDREMHVIKVLTKDGKVQTHRIPGRKL